MRKVIYGLGMKFEEYLLSNEYKSEEIVAFIDKSKIRQGEIINGIQVLPPESVKDIEYDIILVTSDKYYNEIKKELINLGCDSSQITLLEFEKNKYSGELAYWKQVYRAEKSNFDNSNYKELFLNIACENNDDFLKDKVIADFGCGPRGTLAWTNVPKVKIGIDVLANKYMYYFGACMSNHGMIYLNSDEYRIPLPNNYVDVLSTINSLDHVAVLDNMVEEIRRVLKPGGLLLGSFNLNEPITQCEPQVLTEQILNEKLLCYFNILDKKIAPKGKDNTYSELNKGNYVDKLDEGIPGEMWVKAVLK